MRIEKGAAAYPDAIEAVLDALPGFRVLVHLHPAGPDEEAIAARIRARWGADPRVEIVSGQLPRDGYLEIFERSHVILLTHEPGMYGSGTSGVLADGLAAGCVVVSPPLAWAVEAFPGHPRLVWMACPTPEELRAALLEAGARTPSAPQDAADEFAAAWYRIVEHASRGRDRR